MAGLAQWSVADIEGRLKEIADAEAAHAARDLDAELAAVMRKGGDLDKLEEAHLDAERRTRRLRVERVALEGELPEARKREGAERISALAAQHAVLKGQAPDHVARLTVAWQEYLAAVAAWQELQVTAGALSHEASVEATRSGAPMPPMGSFRSLVVEELERDLNRHDLHLHRGLRQPAVITGHGLQSCELSEPAAPAEAA